jgi:predicted metal-dependent hydrolase
MNTNTRQIALGEIAVDVVQKDIKNVHLSVYPPAGRVRISAPRRMDMDTIRVFAISRLSWIRKQQKRFLSQARETPRECVSRESHYYLGKRYLLRVIQENAPAKVVINHETLKLHVRPHTSQKKRQEIMDEWYRKELRELAPAIITRYEQIMDVKVNELGIKKMRTRWGTCSRNRKRVWLNLELAKKPKEYIEYIVVHEMVHLLEKHHNAIFTAYMDKFLPKWRHYKEALNRIPLRHENWSY